MYNCTAGAEFYFTRRLLQQKPVVISVPERFIYCANLLLLRSRDNKSARNFEVKIFLVSPFVMLRRVQTWQQAFHFYVMAAIDSAELNASAWKRFFPTAVTAF